MFEYFFNDGKGFKYSMLCVKNKKLVKRGILNMEERDKWWSKILEVGAEG